MQLTGLVGRVFAIDPEDLGSIHDYVIPKNLKMVLDACLLNTQLNKLCIKDKVEQSRERSSALSYTIEMIAFWSPSTSVAHFTYLLTILPNKFPFFQTFNFFLIR